MGCRKPVVAAAFAIAIAAGCVSLPVLDGADSVAAIRKFYVDGVGDAACSVAVVHGDGRMEFAGDSRAIYRVGSLTKLFVSEALERMAAKGAIDLDAPVTQYSRYSLSSAYGAITLRMLMEHRSGMPTDFLNPWNPIAWHEALCSGLLGSHLYEWFDAREDFERGCNSWRTLSFLEDRVPQYSNFGFALLVSAVEDFTGRSIDDILRKEVSEPMGLRDTAFVPNADQVARILPACAGKLPWMARRGSTVPVHRLGPALVGMGGLYSSAADCARFFSRSDLSRPGRLCERVLPSGRKIDYRFGMIYGGETFVCRDRTTGTLLVILRNVTSWPAAEDFEIADRLFSVMV